jgi:hypothetical protein
LFALFGADRFVVLVIYFKVDLDVFFFVVVVIAGVGFVGDLF